MKFVFFYFFPLVLFGQKSVEDSWTLTYGASTKIFFLKSSSMNIRYISPDFRWVKDGLSPREEERLDKYKNMCFISELIYQPPINVLCLGFYLSYRFLKYKKLNVGAYGGPKFFFISGPDFADIKFLKEGKQMWFFNMGLTCKLSYKIVAPFADIGADGILTVGTSCNFQSIYKKVKKRYHLHTRGTG